MHRQPRNRRVRAARTRLFLETLESRLTPSAVDGATEWPAYPGQWIAQFRDVTGTPAEQITVIDGEVEGLGAGLQVESQLGADGLVLIVGPADMSDSAVTDLMSSLGTVEYVQPNFVLSPDATFFNDQRFSELYGLHNTGQTILGQVGIADADIDAPEAWDITTGSSSVVVGVLDSGIDFNHPDLAANIYTNAGEIPGNGIDDDNNGFIDDVHGWDFFANDNNPQDEHGHGTHVSGTIAAIGNNSIGVVGVAPGVKILPVRWLGSDNTGPMSGAIAAINYANMMHDRGHNIRVTNNSWGGPTSTALEAAIAGERDRGILFVAAAGNSSSDNDAVPAYPGNLNFPNIITVAASDNRDNKAGFSNWGLTTVDLAAPGASILSTLPASGATSGNSSGYGYFNGTSMATPHVTGTAALLWSLNPNATYQQVRDAILGSVDPVSAFRVDGPTPVATGGRLNAFKALQQFGLAVVSTNPVNGSVVNTTPTSFVVNFSRAYASASVQAADLTVNGIAANGFSLTDADTITFTFAVSPVTAEGFQTVALAAGAISPLVPGPGLVGYSGGFYYDTIPLQVVSASPAPSSTVPLPMTFLELTFNEPIDPASIGATDLTLSRGTVTAAQVVAGTGNRTVRYSLSGLTTAGLLTVTLPTGVVADAFGNPGPAAAFTANYGLNAVGGLFPVPLTALTPLGSLAYTGSTAGSIGSIGEQDAFTFSVDAGQTITVVVSPPGAGGGFSADPEEFGSGSVSSLRPTVSLTDPNGQQIAFAEAPAAGSPAVLQVGRAAILGTYTITVGAWAGTDAYSVFVYLNAAVEAEAVGGASNSTRGTAQDLQPAFLDLFPATGAQRAAVRGQLTAGGSPTDDFYAVNLAAGQPLNLALGLSNFNPATSFSATRTDFPVPTGQYPTFVGYRDLNGDGKLDMVAALNNTDNTNGVIGVRLGNGDGTFGPLNQYPTVVGAFTRFLDFGGVNADGKLDVVATSASSGTVSLFLGRGDGTFNPAVNTSVTTSALGLTVRDLNGDGRADAVVPHFDGTISVLLAQANGTFGAPATFSSGGSGPFGSDVGDLNGDGKPDVVTANFSSGNMSVLLGNGSGGFGAATLFSMGAGAWDVALADLNGDGKLDAITGNQNANNIAVRLGNGDGTFGNVSSFATGGNGPRTVAIGDVNNDGKLDVVVPNISSATIGVLPGNGNGTFGAALVFSTGSNPNAATVGDVNGDGLLDISSADASANNVSLRLNTTPNVRLELQNAAGSMVAAATRGATNFDQGLSFTPTAAGTYYARVFGTATNVSYTLVATRSAAFESEPNDSSAAPQNVGAAGGVLGAVASTSVQAVVPNANATVEGNFNNSFPFNIGAFGFQTMRYQQIYARSQFASAGIIDALRFRQDNSGTTNSFSALIDVKINLSYSARTPSNASNVFADNVGAGVVTVIDGVVPISSAPASGNARPFDIVINVADLFTYDPSQGDLLVDITIRNGPAFFVAFDAVNPSSFTTRIFQTDMNATTGQGAFTSGLITRFDMLRPGDDWYAVNAAAGQILRLQTVTPAGGPGEFVNNLNPRIDLFDPSGTAVATGVVGLDGRNESITYQALATGTYRVRLSGQNNTIGEYFLSAFADSPPVANADLATTFEDLSALIPVLANDTDDHGLDPASVTIVSNPVNGSVVVSPTGLIQYTPAPNFSGIDAFIYKVRDAFGLVSNEAAVTVIVTAVADAPTLTVGTAAAGNENAAIPLSIAAALTDTDGAESLLITIAGVPLGGVLSAGTDSGGGTWSLIAAQLAGLTILVPDNQPADAPFTLTVTATARESSNGATAVTTAPIQVTVRNVAPTATFEAPATGVEGTPFLVALTGAADVSPVDTAAGFTYAFDFGSGYGAFGLDASASFTPADNGTFTVRAKVRDKDGGETEYSATVAVANVAPTATLQAPATGVEGSPILVALTGATDVSTVDTAAGFTYAFDFGSGYGVFSADASASVTPADNGNYTVRAKVRDKDGGVTEYTATVAVANVAPTATFEAPAAGVEGSPILVALTGATDVSTVDTAAGFTYAFDFGSGYGAFSADASASFTPTDNGTYTVRAKVRDKDGGVTEYAATVVVANADPLVSLAGPSAGVRGRSLAFAGAFTDAGTADTHEVQWDFGDGTVLAFGPSTAAGALTPTHVFTQSGTYTVRLTVRDDDGGTGSATQTVVITAVAVEPDSQQPGLTALVVGGTPGDDVIVIQPASGGALEVLINGVSAGLYAPTGRLIVFGQAGNDDIQVAGSVTQSAWLYGDDGNDRLKGGAGANVLQGGAGDDFLIGGKARNLLIGGTGADRIIGNSGDDLLIGGATAWDAHEAALWAVLQEWTSAADYDTRVAHLRGTLGGGLNGAFALNDATVFDDFAIDRLTGSSGRDWFFTGAGDAIIALQDGEDVN